jgi:hypothetical protein
MPDDATASDRPAVASAGVSDPRSAMTPRFNLFFRWFAKRYFRHFDLDDATVQRLRDLESRSSVFYVMRYASRLDYFLFNTLFAREGLRLSAFANGLSFYYYQPLLAAIRVWLQRGRMSRAARRELDLERGVRKVREVARSGASAFLFLRNRAQVACSTVGGPRSPRGGASSISWARSSTRSGARASRSTWCRSRCSGERGRAPSGAS